MDITPKPEEKTAFNIQSTLKTVLGKNGRGGHFRCYFRREHPARTKRKESERELRPDSVWWLRELDLNQRPSGYEVPWSCLFRSISPFFACAEGGEILSGAGFSGKSRLVCLWSGSGFGSESGWEKTKKGGGGSKMVFGEFFISFLACKFPGTFFKKPIDFKI